MISKQIHYTAIFLSVLCSLLLIPDSLAVITCSEPKEECIEGKGETRNTENIQVSPGCWKKRFTYECRETADNNCQQLRDQKCLQIGAKCKIMLNGTCVVQDETYNCPVKKCDATENIPCSKDIFCAGGNCASTNPVKAKEKDLEKALAYLSALSDSAKQITDQNTENPIIFAGKSMECSRNILSDITKDCCADNEGVFKCAEDEKELYQMKKAGRAIEVGEYCYNEKLGICTSHHKAYCVFGSRIARIVQNDGRKQLGINFGNVGDDYVHLDCRGITMDELAKMKFDLMDFSELFDEIRKEAEKRAPKDEALMQKSSTYTYDELKEKSTKNMPVTPETGTGFKAAERMKEFYADHNKK